MGFSGVAVVLAGACVASSSPAVAPGPPLGPPRMVRCLTPIPAGDGLHAPNTWPGGLVYYTFNPAISAAQRQKMLDAWSTLSAAANLQFLARSNEPNYIEVTVSTTPGASSSSAIGMTGSQQFLRINGAHWDLRGLLIHETCHALGLYHEHQRPDRGAFVEVNLAAVSPGFGGNYGVVGATPHGPYDFASLMHYDQFGFSAHADRTIRVRPPFQRRWQYAIGTYLTPAPSLSNGDIWVLTALYGGTPPPRAFSLTSPGPGQAVGTLWTPAFSWQASTLASGYHIQVDDSPLFESPAIDAQTTQPAYQHPAGLPINRLHWWRVTAFNAQGMVEAFPLDTQVFYTGDNYPARLHVDDSAPVGGDGLAWPTALRDLGLALETAAASSGAVSEVRVGQGVYRPAFGSSDRSQSLRLPDGCAVLGGFAGFAAPDPDARDIEGHPTVLSGDLSGDDLPGFVNRADNSHHVMIAMSAGASTLLEGFTIRSGNADSEPITGGGGLIVDGGAPVIRRCIFTEGEGRFGGGLAVLLSGADPVVEDCRFETNRAAPGGLGGALIAQATMPFRIDRCAFAGNSTSGGGAVGLYYAGPTIVNGLFTGNEAALGTFAGGGALAAYHQSLPTLVNCTMVANSGGLLGGAVYDDGTSTTRVLNSILWANTPDQTAGDPVVIYSNVQGGSAGTGNINAPPIFGGAAGPYAPGAGSPGIDAGSNFLVPAGVTTDLAGDPRFVDDPATANSGAGAGPLVDMGAYEFQGAPCYPDCDASGGLSVNDYICFQTRFALGDPYADCDANGVRNINDYICFQTGFALGCR